MMILVNHVEKNGMLLKALSCLDVCQLQIVQFENRCTAIFTREMVTAVR